MQKIGVRELRQNASRYLALVAQGASIEVTDRGRPVAMLVPLRGRTWEDLLASGRVTVPQNEVDLADETPADYGIDASSSLEALRATER